jgi:hypothetical protein
MISKKENKIPDIDFFEKIAIINKMTTKESLKNLSLPLPVFEYFKKVPSG